MKPLTIEQLKALEVGDWVWICYLGDLKFYGSSYWKIAKQYEDMLCSEHTGFKYSDYGTKWIAYKNKEQAECKGEIVELPCLREITNSVVGKQKQLLYVGALGYINTTVYNDDEFDESERRLAELTKE